MFLLLQACIENELGGDKQDPPAFDTGDPFTPPDTETGTPPPPTEECNGVDDDDDGAIDEDFADTDGDGVADCLDTSCSLEVASPVNEVDEECEGSGSGGSEPADPWSVAIEWQRLGNAVVSTPTVGDLDQDGVPEVVYSDSTGTVVLDGATGALELSIPGTDIYSGPALGDVDGDGYGDIVTTYGSCFTAHDVGAYDRTGAELWRTSIGTACETYPNLTDLDGDGHVEVIVNDYVLDGETGSVLFTLDGASSDNWGAPAVADMDQDGDQEILLSNGLYDTDGSLLWECGLGGTGAFPQPVNADADEYGELLVAGYGAMTLCDDDGTELWSHSYSSYGSAVAIADFDDDGVQEYAFAKTNAVYLLEPDGSERWAAAVTDASGLAGCTSWDVNYDGVPEVVYADEVDILVIDGVTGTVVIRDSNHGSWTAAETPAVADADGDGQGELIYGSNSGYIGITVIGSADGDWPYAPPVYNQYTYYRANIEDDLSIPTYADAPWMTTYNLFRGQPSAVYIEGTANAHVAIVDVCVASCDGDGAAQISLQAWNDGGVDIESVDVGIYGVIDGVETLDQVVTLGPIPSGTSVETTVDSTITAMGTAYVARIDPEDDLRECDEDDNDDTWADVPCP